MQSLKVIYKKYLTYIRYLTYMAGRCENDYYTRLKRHIDIITNEQHLKEVFSLYVMSFDEKNPQFDREQGGYFREFKKAYYQMMTADQHWANEMLEIEGQHGACMSLILLMGHRINHDTWMS